MPRVNLAERKSYDYSATYTIRVNDLNYAVHVGNAQLVALLHDARTRYLKHLGLSEGNLGDDQTGVVQADLAVVFKGEMFLGDQVLIHCHIDEVQEKSFRLFHRVEKNGATVALAEAGMVTFNYLKRSVVPVPESFLEKLGR